MHLRSLVKRINLWEVSTDFHSKQYATEQGLVLIKLFLNRMRQVFFLWTPLDPESTFHEDTSGINWNFPGNVFYHSVSLSFFFLPGMST